MDLIQRVYASTISADVQDPLGGRIDSLSNVFGIAMNVVMMVGFGMGFVSLALGFVSMVMSEGDKAKLLTARGYLTYGLIAILISMMVASLKFILVRLILGQDWSIPDITTF